MAAQHNDIPLLSEIHHYRCSSLSSLSTLHTICWLSSWCLAQPEEPWIGSPQYHGPTDHNITLQSELDTANCVASS